MKKFSTAIIVIAVFSAIFACSCSSKKDISERVNEIFSTVYEHIDDANGKTVQEAFYSEAFKEQINNGDIVFDANPWINAQDWDEIKIVDIKIVNQTDTEADVIVKSMTMDEVFEIPCKLVFENGNWYVDDINNIRATISHEANPDSESASNETPKQDLTDRITEMFTNVFSKMNNDKWDEVDKLQYSYYSESLKSLYKKAEKIEAEGYIVIDINPWTNAQDYEDVQLLDVKIIKENGNTAEAKVTIIDNGFNDGKKTIPCKLVFENNNWMIDDISNLRHIIAANM